ncbi:hypothetical protein AOLI_G00166710 [Acnodon oligacanthus]
MDRPTSSSSEQTDWCFESSEQLLGGSHCWIRQVAVARRSTPLPSVDSVLLCHRGRRSLGLLFTRRDSFG